MLKAKSIFQNFSLAAVSVLTILILSEIVLRISNYSPELVTNKNDSDFIVEDLAAGYVYRPNLDTVIDNFNYRIKVKINSYGYRDDEWDFSKERNVILVLGDSFTAGYGVDKDQRWSDQLGQLIPKVRGDYKSHIFNAAISGYNLQQMEVTFDKLLKKADIKTVIIGLNINVLDRLNDPYTYFRGFSLKKSKVLYAEVDNDRLYILRSNNFFLKRIELQLMKHFLFYDYLVSKMLIIKNSFANPSDDNERTLLLKTESILHDFMKKSIESHIPIYIMPIVQHDRNMEFNKRILGRYNEIKSFCLSHRIVFVDILPAFNAKLKAGYNFWINQDQHWNKEAHKLAAHELSNYFVSAKIPNN